MITDPIFYRLFETSPETFFLVLGMTPESARETAARYQFEALEFKETAFRLDGVFRPKEPGLPLYFLEVQFYWLPSVYADILAKAYTYLKQHDPGQTFCAVVLFGAKSLEPRELGPYRSLIDAGVLRAYCLDQLNLSADAPLGIAILSLIPQTEDEAPQSARQLILRTRQEISDESLRADLLELIETIILYKLPRLGREEIQAMLQVQDIRQTRVYQEGIQEGLEKAIAKMAASKMTAEDIARILELDLAVVRKVLANGPITSPR